MTEQEARDLISDIKNEINSVRSRAYELNNRKGWKALGYSSFITCCRDEFPELQYRTIQRQLAAAQVGAKLAELRPNGRDTSELPESNLRPLVCLKNDNKLLAEAFDEAVKDADETNNGKLTENIVAKAVEKMKPKPKLGDTAWSQSQLDRKQQVLEGKTVIANMHKDTDTALILWAEQNNKLVRIDRASVWGNPFIMDTSKETMDGDRDTVCTSYELFFQCKPSLQVRLHELQGCVLACWCYPNRCHGQYIADVVNNKDEGN